MKKPIRLALVNIMEGQEPGRQVTELLEAAKGLSNEGMQKMFPLFVKGKVPNETHDCGHCSMFVPSKNACTIVEGDIKANGTCMYQNPSNDYSKPEDEHPVKLSKPEAQYAEMPEGTAINCGSCDYYKANYCKIWMGKVAPNDCCLAHASKDYIK